MIGFSNGQENITKVAIYTRVSTEEQARSGFSLDAQLSKLKALCTAKDWKIVGEYVDEGYTGRNTRRPQYQKMFEDIDLWDGILILKMDRIHRKVKNALSMFEVLEKKGKHFISFMENIDTTTAMGRAMMTITLVFAQLESEQIGERVSIGMIQKAKKSEDFVGHRFPFGYKWEPGKKIPGQKWKKYPGKLIPIPEQLEIVKKAFELYSNGKSIDPIEKTGKGYINTITGKEIEGKEIKRLRTRYRAEGHSFRSIGKILGKPDTTICYFLNNIFYAGYERYCHYFRKIEDIDPIVSPDLWNKIQTKMRSNARSKDYDPLLIPKNQPKNFKLDRKKVRMIPVINRAKHNYNF